MALNRPPSREDRAWECDELGILVDYGEGEWRKYRVGTNKRVKNWSASA
jgi:hypothetical protein